MEKQNSKNLKIAIVGLGYVGLPLAVFFGKANFHVIAYDKDSQKIQQLREGIEKMGEVSPEQLAEAKLDLTDDPSRLREASIIIVAVPTPVTSANIPDMSILRAATKTVGQNLAKGATVVFESTVYPGATEEVCVPIIEQESGFRLNQDFSVGYSPERVNPGDKEHTIDKIVKVVSASNPLALKKIINLYSSIVKAGIHVAPNIKTAEAAKVIENCQRDLNIALMNELSLICEKIGIRTMDVIDAATTKWNIHRYTPGLVGGHCIGVDPYYLVYKAEQLGIHPQVLSAGRRVNDFMASHLTNLVIKAMIATDKKIKGARVLVLGLTFKENVKDVRNSKIAKTIEELTDLGVQVVGCDPMIEKTDLRDYPTIEFRPSIPRPTDRFEAVILSVGHDCFKKITPYLLRKWHHDKPIALVDARNFFPADIVSKNGVYLSL